MTYMVDEETVTLPVHIKGTDVPPPKEPKIVSSGYTRVLDAQTLYDQLVSTNPNRRCVQLLIGKAAGSPGNDLVITDREGEASQLAGITTTPSVISGTFIPKGVAAGTPIVFYGTNPLWIAALGSVTGELYIGIIVEEFAEAT